PRSRATPTRRAGARRQRRWPPKSRRHAWPREKAAALPRWPPRRRALLLRRNPRPNRSPRSWWRMRKRASATPPPRGGRDREGAAAPKTSSPDSWRNVDRQPHRSAHRNGFLDRLRLQPQVGELGSGGFTRPPIVQDRHHRGRKGGERFPDDDGARSAAVGEQ